jgi:hypothetical protein
MSEGVTTEPQQAPDEASTTASDSRRQKLLLFGGLAGLLVLGIAVYFLFLSGGSASEDALGPVPQGTPLPSTSPTNGGQQGPDNKPGNVQVVVGHDPFAPLAVEATESPTPSASSTGVDTGTGTNTGTNSGTGTGNQPQPTTSPTVISTPSSTPTQTQSPDPQPTSYKVTLKSVNVGKDSATIVVNGKRYVVKVQNLFTNSKTGPFKLTWVGQRADGKDTAKVVFGSDAPVELVQNNTVSFQP